jgi:hypothetical protein
VPPPPATDRVPSRSAAQANDTLEVPPTRTERHRRYYCVRGYYNANTLKRQSAWEVVLENTVCSRLFSTFSPGLPALHKITGLLNSPLQQQRLRLHLIPPRSPSFHFLAIPVTVTSNPVVASLIDLESTAHTSSESHLSLVHLVHILDWLLIGCPWRHRLLTLPSCSHSQIVLSTATSSPHPTIMFTLANHPLHDDIVSPPYHHVHTRKSSSPRRHRLPTLPSYSRSQIVLSTATSSPHPTIMFTLANRPLHGDIVSPPYHHVHARKSSSPHLLIASPLYHHVHARNNCPKKSPNAYQHSLSIPILPLFTQPCIWWGQWCRLFLVRSLLLTAWPHFTPDDLHIH